MSACADLLEIVGDQDSNDWEVFGSSTVFPSFYSFALIADVPEVQGEGPIPDDFIEALQDFEQGNVDDFND